VNTLPTDGDLSAARIVHERLVELVNRIALHESRIRHREHGGVHQMRVTLRRLRSLMATFGPLFDRAVVSSLREELAWLAGELGGARDAEIVRTRLHALAGTSDERALVERLDDLLDSAETAGFESAVAALDSVRYQHAFHDLTDFVSEPPWGLDAGEPDEATLRELVHRDWKRMRRRALRARRVIDPDQRQAALHDVRKAAKKLRYSAETLAPLYGRDARRLARDTKGVQTALGELQDSVVTRETLRSLAGEDGWDSAAEFTLGDMHAREQRISARTEDRYARAWAKVSRKKNRRWLF
jgi:CHAD domain-containing protein